ncbi:MULTISPECIES: hypothetical protein [Aerosakkonema]|uniref:hypothetical protein n=1 Tax=Aerosakkonema TaxID=1246629 RepID=UPI0035B94832
MKQSPSQVIPSWMVNPLTGVVSFNVSDFQAYGLEAAEIDSITGDFGSYLRALMELLANLYDTKLQAEQQPQRWSVTKGTPFAITVAGASNPQRVPFQVNVDIAALPSAYEILPE